MPANAGIQNMLKILDPGFPRDDGKSEFRTFYGAVKNINKNLPMQLNAVTQFHTFSTYSTWICN